MKHRLDQRLAIVERAFDGNVVNIGIKHRRHLATLHIGDAALRMQDENIRRVAALECLDCGGTCVAGSRADDRDTPAALCQNMVEKAREDLHRHVLEGQCRSVKKLEQPVIRTCLPQRHNCAVAETRICGGDHFLKICL